MRYRAIAADNEHRLISKVISERDVVTPLRRGVKPEWILDEELRAVWNFLVHHHTKYGECPTAVTVKDNYPTIRLLRVEDSLDYLIDTMVTFVRWKKTSEGLTTAVEVMADTRDTDAVLNTMAATLASVHAEGVPGTNEIDLTKDAEERLVAYRALTTRGGMLGLPTGFRKIDEATAGYQPGQLITFIAPPKTGKSQLCMKSAKAVHDAGNRVLFQSYEMSNAEQQQRYDAMAAQISHGRLRRGRLTDKELVRYERMLKAMAGRPPFTLTDATDGLTVSAFAALLDTHKPKMAFIDGVYLMIDEVTGEKNTPAALTNVTRSLKQLAQRMEIPIGISTQTLLWKMRGGKVTADSIGYSSSFFQDSDAIFGLEEIPDEPEARLLTIVASRTCGPEEVPLVWRWETGCFHDEEDMGSCRACASVAA